MMGRRGKYSTKDGEIITKKERRIVPVPGISNNRETEGLYDIGKKNC